MVRERLAYDDSGRDVLQLIDLGARASLPVAMFQRAVLVFQHEVDSVPEQKRRTVGTAREPVLQPALNERHAGGLVDAAEGALDPGHDLLNIERPIRPVSVGSARQGVFDTLAQVDRIAAGSPIDLEDPLQDRMRGVATGEVAAEGLGGVRFSTYLRRNRYGQRSNMASIEGVKV